MLTLAPKSRPQTQSATPLTEILARGLAYHQSGSLVEAEACYREILQTEPDHAEALHLLGVVAQQNGDYDQAERLIRRAIARNSGAADYHNNLGNTYRLQSDVARAIVAYRQAIALDANHIEALHSLGNLLAERGEFAEAEKYFLDVLRLQPGHSDAHYNFGNAKLNQGDARAAIGHYRRAIELEPGCAAYHFNLAHALQRLNQLTEAAAEYERVLHITPDDFEATYNLGIVLHELTDFTQAADAFRRALRLKPDLPQAMSNLAAALQGLDDYDGAADLLRRALEVDPNFAEAHGNWGGHLWRQGDLTGAGKSCRRAIELNPNLPGAHGNLGHALFDEGDYRGALDCYDHALALKPDFINPQSTFLQSTEIANRAWQRGDLLNAFDACRRGDIKSATGEYCRALATKSNCVELLYYVGLLHLLHGDFAAGWHNYECRWQTKMLRNARRNFPQPQWLGESIDGARILLHAEQGLGDTLQFVRYVPMVAARGAKVILEVPAELRRLIESSMSDGAVQIVTRGSSLLDFDWQSPLLSLPLVFHTDLTSIPVPIPYLQAEPQLIREFAQHIASHSTNTSLRVGVVWSGSPRHTRDRQRSIPLAQISALTEIPGVTFYSLQKGPAAKELLDMPIDMNLVDLSAHLNDFADTAAALANLDLLITVDTAVAHLAGALSKPVWILLTHNPDWRWLLNREDSPWYPTARLFRQNAAGDWSSVIKRVHDELQQLVATPTQSSACS
jgi:tetratricopeptide (TPR) repeat protein